MKTALICGISGQDGAYLAQLLLEKGYTVWGTSRDAQISHFRNLEYLGIKDKVNLSLMVLTDFRSVLQVISKVSPDDIYNTDMNNIYETNYAYWAENIPSFQL